MQIKANLEAIKRHIPNIESLISKSKLLYKKVDSGAIVSTKDIQEDKQVVCIYGLANGLDYLTLKDWLEEDTARYLVFLEDDIDEIASFLASKEVSYILDDPKVRLHFFESEWALEPLLKKIAWEFVFLNIHFFSHPEYVKKSQKLSLQKKIEMISYGCNGVFSDYSDLGILALKNSLKNMLDLPKGATFSSKDKPFFNVPALLCGAGASIEKIKADLPELKKRCLLLSGGAGLNALPISPHFGAIIDKDSVIDTFLQKKNESTPFFLQKRASNDCVSLIKGEKIICFDSFDYLYESWVDKKWLNLSKENFFEAGWNVITFLLQIAIRLGCNPIIFSGVDLALKSDSFYAKGVLPKAIEKKEKVNLIEVVDQNQNKVKTQEDWFLAANFIQDTANEYSNIDFFTLSEGLCLGKQVKKIEVETLLALSNIDIERFVNRYLQDISPLVVNDPVQVVEDVKQKLTSSYANIANVMLKLKAFYEKGLTEFDFEDLLNDTWAFEHLFSPLWRMWKSVFVREGNFAFPTVQKALFLKDVLEKHLEMVQEVIGKNN